MIRVVLPAHLRNLSKTGGEVTLEVSGPVTIQAVLDALELKYPMLQGTIRDHAKKEYSIVIRSINICFLLSK